MSVFDKFEEAQRAIAAAHQLRDVGVGSDAAARVSAIAGLRSPIVDNIEDNQADQFHRRLVEMITGFDAGLDELHEVGIRLVSFGQVVVFHLRDIGFYNPSLITFSGTTDDGNPVELIQHVSQISVLLMKLRRPDPTQPKVRGWFHDLRTDGG